MVDQDFGRQNDPMSRPNLDSTPLGTNKTNVTTSSIESIPVGTKTPEPMPLTRPTEFPEQNGKWYVPGEPDTDPSSSDSSLKKSNSSDNSNSSKSKKKKHNKKKELQKDKKYDSPYPSLRDNYDSSHNSDNRRIRHKRKSNWEKYPIKLCAGLRLTEKLPTTVYGLKIIKFKLNEGPLQRQIYFITFVESLEMIF